MIAVNKFELTGAIASVKRNRLILFDQYTVPE